MGKQFLPSTRLDKTVLIVNVAMEDIQAMPWLLLVVVGIAVFAWAATQPRSPLGITGPRQIGFFGAIALVILGVGLNFITSVAPWFYGTQEGSISWFKAHDRERADVRTRCFLAPDWVDKREMKCANVEAADDQLRSEAISKELKSMGRMAR